METALLGIDLPEVLNRLKEMLIRQGFMVQTMPTASPVLVAYQEGNWYRSARQLVLEISEMDNKVTRVDITAIINNKKNTRHAEELIEENFATAIYENFKSLIRAHGIS